MRTIIEEHLFKDAVNKLGGPERIDAVLGPMLIQIARMPNAFPRVDNEKEIRMATTRAVGSGRNYIPPLRLFFRVKNLETVNLLWIEVDPNQDG